MYGKGGGGKQGGKGYNNNKGGGYNNMGGGQYQGNGGMDNGYQGSNQMHHQQNMGGEGPPQNMLGGPGANPPQGEIPTQMNPDASDFEKENDFVNFFRYIQGHHSCTHSSMIGPSDHRIPKSGKFDVTKPEALHKLYAAVAFFYRQQKPLVLCEIATNRFRFFEDVDLLVPESLKDDLPRLQTQWTEHLLRHRAAVLGAVWRSDDPLGVKCRSEKATVHVFSSSGWSSRHGLPKISLHFVFPELIVTPREAKGIRAATIEFLRESCTEELQELLRTSFSKPVQMDADMSPWEEIFDKAATEGTSLRLVFCDKGAKADYETRQPARLEGRSKVPIGTYKVTLAPGDPHNSVPELVVPPDGQADIQWLHDATIRLDMSNPPEISNVWLSASQTKGMGGIRPQITAVPTPQPRGAELDQYQPIRATLIGKWVDSSNNWMKVQEYPADQGVGKDRLMVLNDVNQAQVAEMVISPDVYAFPVDISYHCSSTGKKYVMHYQPGTDKYGTWFSEDQQDNWMWRRPAVSENPWPQWADHILIEVAGHAGEESSMGLGAIICAVSNVPTSNNVHGEKFWEGHMSFSASDFGTDSEGGVNVPMATVAAVAFGLRAVLDLRTTIGGPKIQGIIISSDHTVVEAAMEGQNNQAYLEPLIQLLTSYKNDIIGDEETFQNVTEIKTSKIAASANKAGKIAKDARVNALDEEILGTNVGDVELFDAVLASYERAPANTLPQKTQEAMQQSAMAAVPQQQPPY